MKMRHNTRHKPRINRASLSGVAVIVVGMTTPILLSPVPVQAAANSLYVSPSSGNVTVNTTIKVGVRINASDSVNAVEAKLAYNASQLECLGIDSTGTAFGVDAPSSCGGGSVTINRGQIGSVTGDKLVASVTFKALTANVTSSVNFASGSQALSSNDSSNVLSSTSGGSYNLKAVATSPPPAGGTSKPTAKPTPPAAPAAGSQPPSAAPPATPATPEPSMTPAPATPMTSPQSQSETTAPSTADNKPTASRTALFGISGLVVLVIAAVTFGIFLRRRHAAAPAVTGAQVGSMFGPPQTEVSGAGVPATPSVVTPTADAAKPADVPSTTMVTPSAPSVAVPTPPEANGAAGTSAVGPVTTADSAAKPLMSPDGAGTDAPEPPRVSGPSGGQASV